MTVQSPRARYTLDDISYRRATWADHPLLKRYRLECGWGLERMERDLKENMDTPLWIFSVPVRVEQTGQVDGESETLRDTKMEDVGMGGLVLDSDAQRFMADRESKTIKLSSLYIDKRHQSLGLGSLCLDLLERLAIEEFKADVLTLDTTPYPITADGAEVTDEDSRNLIWYRRRGYEEFKERIPYYQQPLAIYHAAFLRKVVVRG